MSLSVVVHGFRSAMLSCALVLALALVIFPMGMQAANPPSAPQLVVDSVLPNLFYGGIPSTGPNAPVLVFVHGLSGSFQNWIEVNNCPSTTGTPPYVGPACKGSNNIMYDEAYQAGLRTVFLSLNANNQNNSASIQTNSAMLQTMFPRIQAQFPGVAKFYFICHSKGGLDLQGAIANPEWLGIVNQVLMLGTPNQGDALADWIFLPANQGLGQTLGLLTPAMQSLEIPNVQELRAQWDPIFQNSGIPFYTLSGNTDTCANPKGCSTTITGGILTSITGGTNAPPNDGLVDQPETLLPTSYAMELGVINCNHFALLQGSFSFSFVYASVLARDNEQFGPGFARVSTGGFGDQHNTWAWSMAWFNNNLYVGTGREVYCVTNATAFVQLGLPGLYPPSIGDCTPDYHYLPLQAEIWQFNPATAVWTMVYQSQNTLNTVDNNGNQTPTARDIGFRGLQVVTEPGGGTALYAGGVTSGEIFECVPPSKTTGCTPQGSWPPPEILRTVDGVHWAPIPENGTLTPYISGEGSSWTPAPGAFLGSLTANGCYGTITPQCPNTTSYQNYSIRSATQLPATSTGIVFLQVGDFPGVGRVISAAPGINPALGDNCGQPVCYQWASPPTTTLPVWILDNFNNFVYAGTGTPPGAPASTYGVFKTDGITPPPPGSGWAYNWNQIITDGAYAVGLVADYAMSLQVFADTTSCPGIGCLYVGTDRPNEMVRIHPDGTGTVPVDAVDSWDLVVGNPRTVPPGQPGAGQLVAPISGIGQYFDNGFTVHFWRMGVGGQGLYMGTFDDSADNVLQPTFGPLWSQEFGTDIWRTPDGVHWSFVSKIGLGDGFNTGGRSFASTPYGLFMGTAREIGGTQVFLMDNSPCSNPGCGTSAKQPASTAVRHTSTTLSPPLLYSAPGSLTNNPAVSLSWNAISGAQDYLVYRIAMSGSETVAAPDGPGSAIAAAAACQGASGNKGALCSQLPAVHTAAATCSSSNQSACYGFPGPPVLVTRVTSPAYSETPPVSTCGATGASFSCTLQSLYFVRTEDASGNLSAPSNVVGGPSLAAK
ncbi:MAG: hypothetical protein ABSH32_00930 [Bryobacteraceae bacterium]